MATCAECVHVDVCHEFVKGLAAARGLKLGSVEEISAILQSDDCEQFKDRSRFVELPDVGDYDTVTTIDEAIDHCYQIATSTDETVCAECKAEHMRLCGWLGDLKRRITAEQALKERERSTL